MDDWKKERARAEYEAVLADIGSGIADLPEHLQDGLRRYILDGDSVGGFLTACLENNALDAATKADPVSFVNLKQIMQFLFTCAPSQSWGSAEKVEAWKAHRGARKKARSE